MSRSYHSAETIARAIKLFDAGQTVSSIANALEIPATTVKGWRERRLIGRLRIVERGVEGMGALRPWAHEPTVTTPAPLAECNKLTEEAPPEEPKPPTPKERLKADSLNPPANPEIDRNRIRELEAKVAQLNQQLTWAQHAESTKRTGGVLTLRRSDDHHGDKNHLLSCAASLLEKFRVVVGQYEPDHIQIIGWDDWIAGRGIYKEQDLDSATSDVNEQIAVGAIKTRRFVQSLRETSGASITCHFLRGNHEFAQGVSMAESLFFQSRTALEGIPLINCVYHWDNATINLAAKDTYNVLVRHGHGYSKHSPNSPAFIDAIKDELLVKQRRMQPEEQYHRVLSGHTHWSSCGLERLHGLFWDTTGGLQRNTRIRIGDNQRPVGWIVYVSCEEMGGILQPLELRPDDDTYQREIADPHLAAANMKDVADCLKEYKNLMRDRGVYAEAASFGKLNEGR